ncbi:MAG: hypothetical protein ACP5NG_03240, partial [Conexivisphaera sp.]
MPASEAGELRESRTICSWSGDPGEGGRMDENFANVLGGVSRLARRSPSEVETVRGDGRVEAALFSALAIAWALNYPLSKMAL